MSLQQLAVGKKVRVATRVRPLLSSEIEKSSFKTCRVDKSSFSLNCNNVIYMKDPRNPGDEMQFQFDATYDENSSQSEIFQNEVNPFLDTLFEGYNTTIFCYGITNSGKTFTMQGIDDNPDLYGLIPRTVQQLLYKIERKNSEIQNIESKCKLLISYLEIYNEKVYDLLTKDNLEKQLQLHEDKNKNIVVKGLTSKQLNTFNDFVEAYYQQGMKNRKVASTKLNTNSSRSHAVLTLTIKYQDSTTRQWLTGKINLCDLAGSEDNRKTGNEGVRLKESSNINASLFSLRRVVEQLNAKSKNISYRESKLTRLLQDSLGGASQAVMIINVSSFTEHYTDTYKSLNFGIKSQNIVNIPIVNSSYFENEEEKKALENMASIGYGLDKDTQLKLLALEKEKHVNNRKLGVNIAKTLSGPDYVSQMLALSGQKFATKEDLDNAQNELRKGLLELLGPLFQTNKIFSDEIINRLAKIESVALGDESTKQQIEDVTELKKRINSLWEIQESSVSNVVSSTPQSSTESNTTDAVSNSVVNSTVNNTMPPPPNKVINQLPLTKGTFVTNNISPVPQVYEAKKKPSLPNKKNSLPNIKVSSANSGGMTNSNTPIIFKDTKTSQPKSQPKKNSLSSIHKPLQRDSKPRNSFPSISSKNLGKPLKTATNPTLSKEKKKSMPTKPELNISSISPIKSDKNVSVFVRDVSFHAMLNNFAFEENEIKGDKQIKEDRMVLEQTKPKKKKNESTKRKRGKDGLYMLSDSEEDNDTEYMPSDIEEQGLKEVIRPKRNSSPKRKKTIEKDDIEIEFDEESDIISKTPTKKTPVNNQLDEITLALSPHSKYSLARNYIKEANTLADKNEYMKAIYFYDLAYQLIPTNQKLQARIEKIKKKLPNNTFVRDNDKENVNTSTASSNKVVSRKPLQELNSNDLKDRELSTKENVSKKEGNNDIEQLLLKYLNDENNEIKELKKLATIGLKKAEKIIETRPFKSLDDLNKIGLKEKGISALVEKNKEFLLGD